MRAAFVSLIVVLVWGVRGAEACSCARQGPPCEAYWTADVVFRGRVEAITPAHELPGDPVTYLTVRFTVLEPLKGVGGGTLDIRTAAARATCGYRFAQGREYVVYGSHVSGALMTSACTRTHPIERARDDIDFARTIAAGGAPLGRISGRVLLRARDLAARRIRTKPVPDVSVTIRREDFAVTMQTDRAGEFSVNGLEAGVYRVTLELTARFRVEVDRTPIELEDARGCVSLVVDMYPDARVSGRITDSNGRPVRGLTVDLTARNDPGRSTASPADRLRAVTRDDGSYELIEVPPGRFSVGICTDPADLARLFHPGVTRESESATIVVPLGRDVELGAMVVPAGRFIEMTGTVLDADEVPVEGARVYLRGPRDRDFILGEPVVTDRFGRFTIAGLAGADYVLFAERGRPNDTRGRMDATDPLRVTASPHHPPLTLTLRRRY